MDFKTDMTEGECEREGLLKNELPLPINIIEEHHKNDTLDLTKAMTIAMENGASGIAMFSYRGMDSLQWNAVREWAK